jgi:hypothetical protein
MFVKSLIPFAASAILMAGPALADQRGYSVTSFTRMRVEGPVTIVLQNSNSTAGRAEGDRQAIDRIRVESTSDLLKVGIDRTNWTGDAPTRSNARATLYLSTPRLETLYVIGAGDVRIDRIRGSRFTLVLSGSGRTTIDNLDVEQLTVSINGAGSAKLAGKAKQVRIRSQGEANVDGAALVADDSDVALMGAGEIHLTANRTARNALNGSGRITIDGNPACSGTGEGSGEVLCGKTAP